MQLTSIYTVFLAAASSVVANPTPNPVPGEATLAEEVSRTLETRQININPSEWRFVARLMIAERDDFSNRMRSFTNTLDNFLDQVHGNARQSLQEAGFVLGDGVGRVLGDMNTVADVLNRIAGSV